MVDTTKISTSSTATKEAIKTIAGDEIDDRGIENNAAADQSDAEIKTAYENNANTNAYTDAEQTKVGHITVTQAVDLDALGTSNHAAVTVSDSSEIDLTLVGQQISGAIVAGSIDETKLDASTNASLDLADSAQQPPVEGAFVDGDKTKLDGIENNATADQTAAEIRTLVDSASDSNVFTDADHSKLDGVETGADVTDTANVTAAGALMDSEVTNLAQVKAFDSSDYATAAQGATADSAMQDLVDDTTPQLGGNLDIQAFNIEGADAADLTKLSEVTSTSAELNYSDGVISNIQDQLDILESKVNTDPQPTTDYFRMTVADNTLNASVDLATNTTMTHWQIVKDSTATPSATLPGNWTTGTVNTSNYDLDSDWLPHTYYFWYMNTDVDTTRYQLEPRESDSDGETVKGLIIDPKITVPPTTITDFAAVTSVAGDGETEIDVSWTAATFTSGSGTYDLYYIKDDGPDVLLKVGATSGSTISKDYWRPYLNSHDGLKCKRCCINHRCHGYQGSN
jgi:hypothetical protein